ncbi:hypothetical protein ACM66B_007038 [Microbotryomycetes sp. NB124-2]
MPPEVLVIVRPPPSKQNHPLNLQIQLVNPQIASRTNASRRSTESSRNDNAATSARSSSPSPSSIAGSFDAVASASVTGAANDVVNGVPLKRTPSVGSSRSVNSTRSNRSWSASSGSSSAYVNGSRKVLPLYNLNFHAVMPTVITDAGTDQKLAKVLKRGLDINDFAILDPVHLKTSMSRRNTLSPVPSRSKPSIVPAADQDSPSPSSFLSKFKKISLKSKSQNGNSDSAVSANGLPVVPLFRTASDEQKKSSTSTRPGQGYAFVVRKWTRSDLEGTRKGQELASMIRFEWRRTSGKRARTRTEGATSNGSAAVKGSLEDQGSPMAKARTRSPASRKDTLLAGEQTTSDPNNLVSRTTSTQLSTSDSIPSGLVFAAAAQTHSLASSNGPDDDDDEDEDGNESDPEDSERPYTCHCVISSSTTAVPRKILLGTLTPAPHHPKLVGTLSVPSTLSNVRLSDFEEGVVTVEELKDVLSLTAFWVVVRDNVGGFRDKKRKGEGSGFRIGGHV